MGYRSEVAIKCEPKAFEMLMNVCNEGYLKPDDVITDGKYKILYWDFVKWYSDIFDEVKSIEKCMRWLDEHHEPDCDDELGYHFLRLGEDGSDVEDECNDYDIELNYIRKIELPDDVRREKMEGVVRDIKNAMSVIEEKLAVLLKENF